MSSFPNQIFQLRHVIRAHKLELANNITNINQTYKHESLLSRYELSLDFQISLPSSFPALQQARHNFRNASASHNSAILVVLVEQ